LFTTVSAAWQRLAGASPTASRMGYQLLAALAMATVGVLLVRIRVPAGVVAGVLINPLVVVMVINGGHNDALVGLGILGGALVLRRGHYAGAGACLGLAALTKIVVVLPVAAAVVWAWRSRGRRPALALAAVFGSVCI